MLPTLALIRHEKTVDYVVGFEDMGGKDDFSTVTLARRLCAAGVLHEEAQRVVQPTRNMREGGQRDADDEDSDFE